jgi:hypothetical protein
MIPSPQVKTDIPVCRSFYQNRVRQRLAGCSTIRPGVMEEMPKSRSRLWPVATTTPRGLRLSRSAPGSDRLQGQECLSYSVKHCIRRQFRLNSRTVLAQNQLRHFLFSMFHTVTRSAVVRPWLLLAGGASGTMTRTSNHNREFDFPLSKFFICHRLSVSFRKRTCPPRAAGHKCPI